MANILLDYVPAELRENKEWYVRFYVKNPATDKLQLKKIKINRITSITERRRYGRRLVSEINKRLERGWNPFVEQESSKSFHNIYDIFNTFLKVKKKELGEYSIVSYIADTNMLIDFIKKIDVNSKMYAISFNKDLANKYMNYFYLERNVGERRYNNVLRFCNVLFNWMVDNQYIKANPFAGIKRKKVKNKIRQIIPPKIKDLIYEHLKKADRLFLINLLIQYHSLLRPKETLWIKVKHIDLERQIIIVNEEAAKNSNTRIATIPNVLLSYIKELDLDEYNPELYVFSHDLKPGKEKKYTRYLSAKWTKMRKKIKLANYYQMYNNSAN